MRNLRRDTSGNVIGGMKPVDTRSGSVMMPFGTAKQAGPALSATPRLDAGVQTPRMDSNLSGPVRYTTPEARMAEMRAASQKSTLSGAFGLGAQRKAENLQGRQSLFSRMQAAGAGGISPAMKQEAAKLGVTPGGWRNALGKLSASKGSLAEAAKPMPMAGAGGNPYQVAAPVKPQPTAAPKKAPWRIASR